jgi:hypothetical protein
MRAAVGRSAAALHAWPLTEKSIGVSKHEVSHATLA